MHWKPILIVGLCCVFMRPSALKSQEKVLDVLQPSVTLEANRADEPLSESFSFERAVRFMDNSSAWWQDRKKCVTCHTNGLYLVGRAMLRSPSQESEFSRKFAQSYLDDFVLKDRKPSGQYGAIAGLVTTAAMLAISDQLTKKKLQPTTQRALDYVWSKQDESGAWTGWLKCDWPPFEQDDHFGVSLMSVAVGMAGDEYAQSPAAKLGMRRVGRYLAEHPPANAHQKGMLLWAAKYTPSLVSVEQKRQWTDELLALQREDGGWSLLSLGDATWKRAGNGHQQDTQSDGYGTGFAIFMLRQAGVAAEESALVRGIDWLKSNQRVSGRWFTRSLKIREKPSKHYISHAGTTFAVMALIECRQPPSPIRSE